MDVEKLRDSIIVLENEINRIFEENIVLKTKMISLDQSLEKLNNLLETMLLSLSDDNVEMEFIEDS